MNARQPDLRLLTISALTTALAVTLPIAFHLAGLGATFQPLLLPLLLNGFLVPVGWAVLCGAAAPVLSALATGMPPLYPPIALIMSAEAVAMSGVASVVYGYTAPRIWLPLLAAVALGRCTSLALTWGLAGALGLPPALSVVATLLYGLPGVVLQCTVVPVVVRTLRQRRSPLLTTDPDEQTRILR